MVKAKKGRFPLEEHRYKILIVEDETNFREPLRKCLSRRLKVNLSEVDNGPDAVEAISKIKYDLVLLDINIPGCDGWDVIRRVREFNKDIKIIVISGCADFSASQKEILSQQTSWFAKKPISVAELTRQISCLLDGDVLTPFPASEFNDYKGRPEVRELVHAFENIFNNIEAYSQGFVSDYNDGLMKDKSKEEITQETLEIMERISRIITTRNQLFEILRKL